VHDRSGKKVLLPRYISVSMHPRIDQVLNIQLCLHGTASSCRDLARYKRLPRWLHP
jgi:hypothetical protein